MPAHNNQSVPRPNKKSNHTMKMIGLKYLACVAFALDINVANMPSADISIINLDVKRDAQTERRNSLVGKIILITGRATNAKMGAVLSGKYGPVFIKQLEIWPESLYGKSVTVKGVLTKKFYEYHKHGYSTAAPQGLVLYIDKYEVVATSVK